MMRKFMVYVSNKMIYYSYIPLLFLEVAEGNYIVPGLDLSKWLNSWQIQYIVFRMFNYEGIDPS